MRAQKSKATVRKKSAKKKAKKKVAKKKVLTQKKTKKKATKKKAAKKKVAKKKVNKKVAKKKATKKKAKTIRAPRKPIKKKANKKKATKRPGAKLALAKDKDKVFYNSILELIRITSTVIPDDIQKVILEALNREKENTTAKYAMEIIDANIGLAKKKSQPICQDTGTIHFYIYHPMNFDQKKHVKIIEKAVVDATKLGYLRQNSVDSLTGKNDCMNVGNGHPDFHFYQHERDYVEIKLMLKGGGCENVGAQYSLPNTKLEAGRDLDGVRKVILDAIIQAQGKGCGPGVLGVCIGGDRGSGYIHSKKQLFRKLDDQSDIKELADLEKDIVETANKLGIGPMGFGGTTTLLGCKISHLNRLPASYFVSVSYMCWAYRRQGVRLDSNLNIKKWLY